MINALDILHLAEWPDGMLIRSEGGAISRGELLGRGAAFADSLEHAGVCRGGAVIVSLDSGPSFIAALAGCWLVGATPVLLDPLVRREITRAVRLTRAQAIVRGGEAEDCGNVPVLVPTEQVAARADAPSRESETPILWLFTSGSTGEPTLVPKSFAQLDVELRFLTGLFESPLRVATMAPWCHIFGLLLSCLLPARTGGFAELGAGISPKKMLESAAASRVDLAVVVPAVLRVMVKVLESNEGLRIPPSCRFVTSGAPLAPALRSKFTALTGCAVTDLYGSTEAGGVAFRHDDGPWVVQPHVETRMASGGFLEVRSASVSFPGEDGFYRIGDMVRFEGAGFVLKARADDVVKIGGRRTSLNEVSEALEMCPGVGQAVCLATEVRGALRLVAFVTANERDLSKELIRSFVRSRLSDHKVPGIIRVVPKLPQTPAGKIDRRQLLEMFHEGQN